jgi:hypothetical protein
MVTNIVVLLVFTRQEVQKFFRTCLANENDFHMSVLSSSSSFYYEHSNDQRRSDQQNIKTFPGKSYFFVASLDIIALDLAQFGNGSIRKVSLDLAESRKQLM